MCQRVFCPWRILSAEAQKRPDYACAMATEPLSRAPIGCRSSEVEHSLGKGEVESSILSGSTINPHPIITVNAPKGRGVVSFLTMSEAALSLGYAVGVIPTGFHTGKCKVLKENGGPRGWPAIYGFCLECLRYSALDLKQPVLIAPQIWSARDAVTGPTATEVNSPELPYRGVRFPSRPLC